MKKLVGGLIAVFALFSAHTAFAEEVIRSFNVDASLSRDRKLTVTETIQYDFGDAERHGIYRYIPEVADRNGAKYKYRFDFTSVTMDSKPVTFINTSGNGNVGVKIGDADKTITGPHTYTITYVTDRAVNDFSDHRELYWNVTGNGWTVPIERSTFVLHGPGTPTQTVCFTGYFGSTAADCTIKATGSLVTIATKGALNASEGMTFAVAYPLDAMDALSLKQKLIDFVVDNLWAFLPVITFIVMFLIWRKYGREPEGRGTVIPEYEEPDKTQPAYMAALMTQKNESRGISATILDLARRGYLKIKFVGDPNATGWFAKKPEIFFLKLKAPGAEVEDFENNVWQSIFSSGLEEVPLNDLKGEAYKEIQKAQAAIGKAMVEKKWMRGNPTTVRGLWIAAAILMGFQSVFLVAFFGGLYIVASIICAGIIFAFGWQMPQRTKEGAIMKERCEGFKWFLSVTEKQRLDFTDAPERQPDQFARFLPAAVAFGVEEKWAGQFASMQIPPPSYMDMPSGAWTALAISNAMGNFNSAATSSMYTAPSSAGSGGSGFGGGGSGGGGGGGGGGSW